MLKKTKTFRLNGLKKHLVIKHFNDAGHIRSIVKTLEYVTKDGHVTCYPTGTNYKAMIKSGKAKKGVKADLLLDEIIKAPHDTDIDEFITDMATTELGSYAAFKVRPISDFFKIYHGTQAKRMHLKPSLPVNLASWILGQNHPTVDIWMWLKRVLENEMMLGDKHLYIWGPTMSGKTSLISYLMTTGWSLYFIPKSEDFIDGIKDKKWDLAIADEVRGKDQTIQFWNQWCDCFMPLKQKGKQAFLKTRIIPTIILSNYEPSKLFPKVAKDNPDILEAFERRFTVIPVGPTFGCIDLPK